MKSIAKLSLFLLILGALLGSASLTSAYNNYNYSSCNYHAYRDCVGTAIYWFDSCSVRQDLYQDCSSFGQTCKYGQCVLNYNPAPNPYVAHSKIQCYGNNVYWYDSLGVISDLYKNCSDNNSCTIDSCAGSKCSNILKCDGSSCASGSADYNVHCAPVTPIAPVITTAQANLSVSFVVSKDQTSSQWDKTLPVSQNSTIYFMIVINNNSDSEAKDVNVSVNIPTEVSLLGNLKVDNAPLAGDIVSGFSIGTLGAGISKSVTFEGKTQIFATQEDKQAIAKVAVGGATQSDALTLSFVPGEASSASVSSVAESSGIVKFLKRWYLWIFVGVVLIFLFIIVFRRLSSAA